MLEERPETEEEKALRLAHVMSQEVKTKLREIKAVMRQCKLDTTGLLVAATHLTQADDAVVAEYGRRRLT